MALSRLLDMLILKLLQFKVDVLALMSARLSFAFFFFLCEFEVKHPIHTSYVIAHDHKVSPFCSKIQFHNKCYSFLF